MMNTREAELRPSFKWSAMSTMKGTNTRHVVMMNPNEANQGEELYIDIPKLKPDGFLVSGSLHLQFDCRNSKAKS